MDRIYTVLFSLLLGGMSLIAIAEDLTPERYVLADLESRSVTLTGMEARLSILQQGAGLEEQLVLDDFTRAEIDAVFARFGTTGPSHTIYGTQQRDVIDAFLVTRPDLQAQYSELEARFDTLSLQFGE